MVVRRVVCTTNLLARASASDSNKAWKNTTLRESYMIGISIVPITSQKIVRSSSSFVLIFTETSKIENKRTHRGRGRGRGSDDDDKVNVVVGPDDEADLVVEPDDEVDLVVGPDDKVDLGLLALDEVDIRRRGRPRPRA